MRRYIQHEYLKVSHFTTKEWLHPVHNHNHFEIIFIHRGSGVHCLSGMHYPYSKHSVFLLAPCDTHHFQIEEETEFSFLKFTNVYLAAANNAHLANNWNNEIDRLLMHARSSVQPLPAGGHELEKLEKLFQLIVQEWKETRSENNETIYFLMLSLFSLMKRLVRPQQVLGGSKHNDKIVSILNYIHEHIYNFTATEIEHLAERFSYSKNYLGIYFKEQTGVSVRDYVGRYRLQVIENRLRYSSFSLKEICSEFGFTDMSHFNKFFKKYHGQSPSVYRAGIKQTSSILEKLNA